MIQSCTLYALSGQPHLKMEYIACQMKFNTDLSGQTVCSKYLFESTTCGFVKFLFVFILSVQL